MKSNNEIVAFGMEGWMREVMHRPLNNIHRRTLDATWRKVIEFGGGDANDLVGPSHDDLLRSNPKAGHRKVSVDGILRRALERIVPNADEWLQMPNAAFDGATPEAVIERGDRDRIWEMIRAVESGEPGACL